MTTINSVKFEFLRMAIEEGYRDPVKTMQGWYEAILEQDVEEEPEPLIVRQAQWKGH